MITIFILPKDQECKEKNIITDMITNPNFKILVPNGLIVNGFNGLDEAQTAKNIINKMNEVQPIGEKYLLFHIGDLVDISSELGTLDAKLVVRMYSSADGDAQHTRILNLIQSVLNDTIVEIPEQFISEYFYDKVLEAKLKLLHECMDFTAEPVLDNLLIKNYKEHYSDFLKAVKGLKIIDPEKEYINALTDLRKVLLGS